MANIKKLIELAREHLEINEEVKCVIFGTYETKILGNESVRAGVFLATNKRLIFFAKKMFGFDLEIFPYSNISSIEINKGMMGHSISFFTSGNKVKMKWITEENKGDVQKFVEYVKENMNKNTSGENSSLDIVDQIKKLAELKEQGILSEGEFQTQKTKLLSKI